MHHITFPGQKQDGVHGIVPSDGAHGCCTSLQHPPSSSLSSSSSQLIAMLGRPPVEHSEYLTYSTIPILYENGRSCGQSSRCLLACGRPLSSLWQTCRSRETHALRNASNNRRRRPSLDHPVLHHMRPLRQTEDFYFTLDLTTHVPDALASKEKSANGRLMPTVPVVDEPDDEDELDDDHDRDQRTPGLDPTRASDHRTLHDEPSSLQFLDLHSDAPLIKFGKGLYRGQWSTDLGTQFYVSRPHVVEEPLKPGNIADVIGISRVRLLSRPVTLRRRPDWVHEDAQSHADGEPLDPTPQEPVAADEAEDGDRDDHGQRPTLVPRENLIKPEHKIQASFLERLSRIKMAKGELDPVPATYGMIKYDAPPEGWEAIQQQALQADELEAQEKRKRLLESTVPKPRKRRRRKFSELGLQTKAGGEAGADRGWSKPARVGAIPSQQIRASLGLQTVPEDEDGEGDDDENNDDDDDGGSGDEQDAS
nr:hypothetical protein CFP56_19527 [Quercus suber]